MANNLVSIIMPCYNSEAYLGRALDSVLGQTYNNIELVAINDGSQDGTLQMLHRYESKFQERGFQLVILSQKNEGPGYAAINGLERATGVYLSYLDSDDLLLPESIQVRAMALDEHPDCGVSRTNGYKVNEDDLNHNVGLIVENDYEKRSKNLFNDLIIGRANNLPGTFMVRASVLKHFYKGRKIPRSDFGQNLQMLLPGAWKQKNIYIDRPLMKYVIRRGSHSHPKTLSEQIRLSNGYYDIRIRLLQFIDHDFSALIRQANIRKIRIMIGNILHHEFLAEEPDNRKALYDRAYSELKALGGLNWEHRTYYAAYNHSRLLLFYRVMYKLERLLTV